MVEGFILAGRDTLVAHSQFDHDGRLLRVGDIGLAMARRVGIQKGNTL